MAELDIGGTTTTNMEGTVKDFEVAPQQTDGPGEQQETFHDYVNFTKYFGYYKEIPELKKAIDALATWTIGKGFTTDDATQVSLARMTGSGKDTIETIFWNMFVMKKAIGGSFTEIIKNPKGTLINLKPLNTGSMRTIYGPKGDIIRFEQRENATTKRTFKPTEMLYLLNDRVADDMGGTSIIEACQWVIDARNEAMEDKRRVHHRSTIRVIEVDSGNKARLAIIKTQYGEAIKNGEVLLVPKGNYAFPDAPINFLDTQEWIRYLENFFYQAVGVPRVIATSENFTEASSKVGYLTFEPVYTREQVILEAELWSQLGIRVKFNRPPSLMGNVQKDEAANTGQVGFQPNDVQAGAGQ